MPRGRKPLVEPAIALNVHLPESVRGQLDLFLHSELEGRVPKGAYQRFLQERITEFFGTQQLDLAPFVGSQPGELTVRGTARAVTALRTLLENRP